MKINKQKLTRKIILEQYDQFDIYLDAMILLTLHEELSFGKDRLLKFRKKLIEKYKDMKEYYIMDDAYPAIYKLKDIGIDIEKIIKEEKHQ